VSFTFGIFDSFDQGIAPAAQVLLERVQFAREAERLGIDHYHVTEHHGTPLSVCPSPNIFLAAISQTTRRMRLGALVYVLPAYSTLRLAEEISALDQLSNGRLDVGVGSGISPYESALFGIPADEMKPRYAEALDLLLETLATGRIKHTGTLLPDYDATLSITPRQSPHPPIWYASSNTRSAVWAAEHEVSFVGRWGAGSFIGAAREYWATWQSRHQEAEARLLDGTHPRVGLSTTVVIGESEQQALDRYHRAYTVFGERVTALWHANGNHQVDSIADPAAGLKAGSAIVGTRDSVRDQVVAQVEAAQINYFEIMPLFGDLSYDEGVRTLSQFSEHVMPSVRQTARSVLDPQVGTGVPA
jgi:alkanesulfonate monooxygenase SsuD/methylene tetrahydromethanopterin reductase-like flavin-dependent oxidoreductase (luciferase family)